MLWKFLTKLVYSMLRFELWIFSSGKWYTELISNWINIKWNRTIVQTWIKSKTLEITTFSQHFDFSFNISILRYQLVWHQIYHSKWILYITKNNRFVPPNCGKNGNSRETKNRRLMRRNCGLTLGFGAFVCELCLCIAICKLYKDQCKNATEIWDGRGSEKWTHNKNDI